MHYDQKTSNSKPTISELTGKTDRRPVPRSNMEDSNRTCMHYVYLHGPRTTYTARRTKCKQRG